MGYRMVIGKRQRVEDFGYLRAKIEEFQRDYPEFIHECKSKHTLDPFIEKYRNNEEGLEEIHNFFRGLEEWVFDLWGIARGLDEDD